MAAIRLSLSPIVFFDGNSDGLQGGYRHLVLENCDTTVVGSQFQRGGAQNLSKEPGGSTYVYAGKLELDDCEFRLNTATGAGAIHMFGPDTSSVELVARNSRFLDNSGDYDFTGGPGAVFVFGNARFEGCAFENNSSTRSGAIRVAGLGSELVVVRSTFSRNTSYVNLTAGNLQGNQAEGGADLR